LQEVASTQVELSLNMMQLRNMESQVPELLSQNLNLEKQVGILSLTLSDKSDSLQQTEQELEKAREEASILVDRHEFKVTFLFPLLILSSSFIMVSEGRQLN